MPSPAAEHPATPPQPPFAYDRLAYPSHARPQSHPDRLATLAHLFAMDPAPAPPARCRVLELGCGDATNLLAIALVAPESLCVGVDLSADAVARGNAAVKGLGLRNVALHHASAKSVTRQWGQFDYVIAHGLYSWVPPDVRDAILRVCFDNLAPHGVAYVSYNVHPGGHLRRMVRDVMRYHARGTDDPVEQVRRGRALLRQLADAGGDKGGEKATSAYRAALREEADRLANLREGAVFHDDLAETNDPVYFHEFAAHARRQGLRFLSEADFADMSAAHGRNLPPGAKEVLAGITPPAGVGQDVGGDAAAAATEQAVIDREQYLDFVRGRKLRQTLLCHASARAEAAPRPDRVAGLLASCPARPAAWAGGAVEFRTPAGAALTTAHPLVKSALQVLCDAWPRRVSFDELTERASAAAAPQPAGAPAAAVLCEALTGAYAVNVVGLHRHAPPLAPRPGPRPAAFPLARLQAAGAAPDAPAAVVTTALGDSVRLDGPLARRLLAVLDGSRGRSDLVRELSALAPAAGATADLDAKLNELARLGLLVG